jgi:hypothetical protein
MFENADLIHRYSRAQAIADGVLIDVSETARGAGIRWPVALTRAAWAQCVAVPPGVACQDEAGRLWGVLLVLHFAACGADAAGQAPRRIDSDGQENRLLTARLQSRKLARLRDCNV